MAANKCGCKDVYMSDLIEGIHVNELFLSSIFAILILFSKKTTTTKINE